MDKINNKSNWTASLALGSLWGLSEAGMGMALRGGCSRMLTGSIMTGAAIFFFSAGLAMNRKSTGLLLMLGIATVYKLLDAFFLQPPVLHGAIANPVFAFYTEVFAFILIWKILDARLKEKNAGRALWGGITALLAVNLFPLVKYATGIPACVYPGTQYPLALYFAPVAVALSALACPLGMAAGERLAAYAAAESPKQKAALIFRFAPLISLIAVVCLRLGGKS